MRRSLAVLLALVALGCTRESSLEVQIAPDPGRPLSAFLYRGDRCPDDLREVVEGGVIPEGYFTQFQIEGGEFSEPSALGRGTHTLLVAALDGCDITAADCETFEMPPSAPLRFELLEATRPVRWTSCDVDPGGVDAGPGGDAGPPDMTCETIGAGCELVDTDGRCCRDDDGIPACWLPTDCTCERLNEGDPCDTASFTGTCRGDTCVEAAVCDVCAPPLACDLAEECLVSLDLDEAGLTRQVDVVWYQLDEARPFQSPNGTAVGPGRTALRLPREPPEDAQVCLRPCSGLCPCVVDATERVAFGALMLDADADTSQFDLPAAGADDDLVFVWASERVSMRSTTNPELDGLGYGRDFAFSEAIPEGHSVWRAADSSGLLQPAGGMVGGLVQTRAPCFGCLPAIAPR